VGCGSRLTLELLRRKPPQANLVDLRQRISDGPIDRDAEAGRCSRCSVGLPSRGRLSTAHAAEFLFIFHEVGAVECRCPDVVGVCAGLCCIFALIA